MFWVRVPVLSEQITDTAPRVSTALSSFMMAFSLAIFWVPMAWTMVTMELRASGMAATARATANMRESRMAWAPKLPAWYRDRANTPTQMMRIIMASRRLNWSRLSWRGVLRRWVWFIRAATFPSSVSIPVPVITTRARP